MTTLYMKQQFGRLWVEDLNRYMEDLYHLVHFYSFTDKALCDYFDDNSGTINDNDDPRMGEFDYASEAFQPIMYNN